MKKSLRFLVLASGLVLLAGICATSAQAQGGRSGSTPGGSGGSFNGISTGGSTGGGSSGSSSSLFNSGSGSSSSSLFNSGSSSSGSSTGGSTSGSSSGGTAQNLQTEIDTGQIGAATPITRGAALERNTSGAYLINSNPDIIGGQPSGNSNQFANLFSQIGRSMNQGGNFNQQGGRNAARSTLRIPLRMDLMPKPVFAAPQFTVKFESRLAKLPAISAIGPIRVTMDGSTAVLTGVVASEQDRQLAAGVALLEPEVETVRNELTVQAAAEGLNSPSNIP